MNTIHPFVRHIDQMTKVETREGRRVRIGGINVWWVGKNPHHTENGNE